MKGKQGKATSKKPPASKPHKSGKKFKRKFCASDRGPVTGRIGSARGAKSGNEFHHWMNHRFTCLPKGAKCGCSPATVSLTAEKNRRFQIISRFIEVNGLNKEIECERKVDTKKAVAHIDCLFTTSGAKPVRHVGEIKTGYRRHFHSNNRQTAIDKWHHKRQAIVGAILYNKCRGDEPEAVMAHVIYVDIPLVVSIPKAQWECFEKYV